MIKESILNIEGIDKTGKDSVRPFIIKKSKGKILVKIRTYMSQIVYSRINKRNIDESFFLSRMKEDFDRGDKFVLLTASDDIIKERCLMHNERDIAPSDVAVHKEQFAKLTRELHKAGVWVHLIDTSSETPEESAYRILELFEVENG